MPGISSGGSAWRKASRWIANDLDKRDGMGTEAALGVAGIPVGFGWHHHEDKKKAHALGMTTTQYRMMIKKQKMK